MKTLQISSASAIGFVAFAALLIVGPSAQAQYYGKSYGGFGRYGGTSFGVSRRYSPSYGLRYGSSYRGFGNYGGYRSSPVYRYRSSPAYRSYSPSRTFRSIPSSSFRSFQTSPAYRSFNSPSYRSKNFRGASFTPSDVTPVGPPPEGIRSSGYTSLDRGWSLLASGDDQAALLHFAELANANTTDAESKVGYALSAAAQGDLETSAWAIRRAIDLQPDIIDRLRTERDSVISQVSRDVARRLEQNRERANGDYVLAAVNESTVSAKKLGISTTAATNSKEMTRATETADSLDQQVPPPPSST
ncbi:MAG: hypothetical protein AAFU85_17685 [Planctomycetota bacterium]